jgi:rhamnosyltransferase
MKLLGIVILYYPDSDIISNISSYLHFLHALIIWNNTPLSNHPKKEFEDLSNSTPIIFMGENENVGIGKALNKAVEYATKKGYTHLLTMDQNSYFDENTFSEYLSKIEKIKNNSVVAFCVNTNKLQLSDSIIKVESFITSGTIMKVEVFKTIGLFREDFFIDAIDTEYSYRIRKNRYQILQFCDIFIHFFGGN